MVVPPRAGFIPRFKDLERKSSENFTTAGTRTGYTRIQGGALEVFNDDGDIEVRVGKQDDDDRYDIALRDDASGLMLPGKQLLAPPLAQDASPITISDTDLPMGNWITNQGPSVNCHVYTGFMIVTLSVSMRVEATVPTDFWVDFTFTSGPTAHAPDQDEGMYIRFDASSGQSAVQQSSKDIPVTGLTPGDYTVAMTYKANSTGSPHGSASATRRGLIIKAY